MVEQTSTLFRELFGDFPGLVCIADFNGFFVELSPHWEKVLGYTKDELLARPYLDLVHPGDRDKTKREAARLSNDTGATVNFENRYLHKNGHYLHFRWSALPDHNRKLIFAFATDISEEWRTSSLLEKISGAARIGGWELELATGTLHWTRETYKIHELSESHPLDVNTAINFYSDESQQKIREAVCRAINDGVPYDLTLKLFTAKGREVTVRTLGFPEWGDGRITRIFGTIQDVTLLQAHEEKIKLIESQLRRSQKMEAIGRLAGGIAHDFNNIIAAILGCAELAYATTDADDSSREYLRQILRAAARAKSLVDQILTFSRERAPDYAVVSLPDLVRETTELLRASAPSSIEIRTFIEQDSLRVFGNDTELEQVLLNLGTNGVGAMQNGGTLTISLVSLSADSPLRAHSEALQKGAFVSLTVEDTGVGMSRDVMERIFDPFFTTKTQGKGTGLGLSVVHGIVKSHGGFISVESIEERGSVFRLLLPLFQGEAPSRDAARASIAAGNGERVLVVDDEEVIVSVTTQLLERMGYKPIPFHTGDEALRVFKKNPDAFDLVITDQTMPGLCGVDLCAEILKLRPSIPVILCTGFSPGLKQDQISKIGIGCVLSKPYTLEELCEAICEVLQGKRRAA